MTVQQILDDQEWIETISTKIIERLRDEGVISSDDQTIEKAEAEAEEALRESLEEADEEMP